MLLARILSYASSVSKQSAFIFLFSVAVPFWLLSFALVQMKDEDSGGERGGTEIITSQQMLR